MRPARHHLAAYLTLIGLVAACAGGAGSPAPPTDPSSGAGSPPSSRASERPLDAAWAATDLTDVTSGATFRVVDLVADGKVVFLETMAIWCTNCRVQQEEAALAFADIDPDRVAWIAIDVETTETAEALAAYREQHGFPFTYVVADRDLARALVADFGDVVLSPPAVNIIVVGSDGRVAPMRGHKTADDIRRLAAEYGA